MHIVAAYAVLGVKLRATGEDTAAVCSGEARGIVAASRQGHVLAVVEQGVVRLVMLRTTRAVIGISFVGAHDGPVFFLNGHNYLSFVAFATCFFPMIRLKSATVSQWTAE